MTPGQGLAERPVEFGQVIEWLVLIPLLDLNDTADPIEDHLAALRLLEGAAGDVDVLVPRPRVHRRS